MIRLSSRHRLQLVRNCLQLIQNLLVLLAVRPLSVNQGAEETNLFVLRRVRRDEHLLLAGLDFLVVIFYHHINKNFSVGLKLLKLCILICRNFVMFMLFLDLRLELKVFQN